jgi:hypothetical protein
MQNNLLIGYSLGFANERPCCLPGDVGAGEKETDYAARCSRSSISSRNSSKSIGLVSSAELTRFDRRFVGYFTSSLSGSD